MRILLIITIFVFIIPAQNLDSLMNSGIQQMQQLKMAPVSRKLFYPRDTLRMGPRPLTSTIVSNSKSIADLEKRTRDLEISTAKISVILENMQKVNENHTGKFEVVMHFLEVIITTLAGIATVLIGVYIKSRKKMS